MKPKTTTLTKQINVVIYFENLTVELHVFYVLKTHVKFYVNRMLFIIWSINLNFYLIIDYKNSKFKDLIDDITIDFGYSWNFASMEDIRRKYNPMVNFSQFTSNKKILSKVIVLVYNQICCQILSKN